MSIGRATPPAAVATAAEMAPSEHAERPQLTVLYDGGCPLCSREIAWYRGLPTRCAIAWKDVSTMPEDALPPGVSRQAALARLHVMLADGSMQTGASAFIALWSRLSPTRPLGRLASVPPMPWLLERAYVFFLWLRPSVQRFVAKQSASSNAASSPSAR